MSREGALMIVVLSLNTAVDRLLVVPDFHPGAVYRARRALVYPAGKGLNVARAVRRLGQPVRVVGFLGGSPADFVRRYCSEIGMEQRWVETAEETRTCVLVVDPEGDGQTVVNEPGPHVSPEEVERLRREVLDAVGPGDILCISGSAPPGVPDGFYSDIAREMEGRSARVLADVAGAPLRRLLEARTWALAPNDDECRAVFGAAGSAEDRARRLSHHTEHALLTLGREGALYAASDVVWRLRAPEVETVNAVGSGDAFVAGFVSGIAQGLTALDAVRLGVACGASNASHLELGVDSEEVEGLAAGVVVERVPSSPNPLLPEGEGG